MTNVFNIVRIIVLYKHKEIMKTLLSPSIEKRATELMLSGVEAIEAVKQALIEETNMIGSLITSSNRLTERGQIASDELFNRYNKN